MLDWFFCSALDRQLQGLAAGGNLQALSLLRHICDDCGKAFQNNSALQKHVLIHSNRREYRCHYCNKGFKRHDHL